MILTKEGYITSIGLLLPDNSTQQISPEDLRTSLTNLADSVNSFLVGQNIAAKNVASVSTRTTLVGEGAIDKRELFGRSNQDNSAFGYNALHGNYDGVKNTAIGATALSCNLYGDQNVAVGYNAVAGNTTGSGNVGVGNFTLQTNKKGHFNIAIGHGAGSYVGEESNYNFYVGAHPVDYEDLCDLEIASGNLPLLFGDLLNRKLGIGVNTLHGFGAVQSSGDVCPSDNDSFNLGHPSYNWGAAFLSSGLSYSSSGDFLVTRNTPKGDAYPDQYTHSTVFVMDSGGAVGIHTETPSGTKGALTVAGNIVPHETHIYALGSPDLKWDGWFNDIIVSGNATINDLQYTTINECIYDCKTLHLATSGFCDPSTSGLTGGALCGYLSDGSLDGAGFEVHSSGSDYIRDYRFIFKEPDQGLTCLEVDSNYARSRWQSNISIEVTDGQHMQTQRVLSDDKLSLATQSGCHGLFFRASQATSGNVTYLGSEDNIDLYSYVKDVNFIGGSGNDYDYYVSVGSPSSGISVGLDLGTRISGGMVGFGLENNDDLSPDTSRFSLRTHNYDSNVLESLNILRVSGLVGITDIAVASGAAPVVPAALFNVQGGNGCDVRFSASGLQSSSLDIIANGNTRASGVQIAYNPLTDTANFSLIRPSGGVGQLFDFMSVTNDGSIFIGQTPSGLANSGTIAIREQDSAPSATSLFGKLYVKPKFVSGTQTQSLYFRDDGGNEFNIVRNEVEDDVYGDERGNTYAGAFSPASRPTLSAHHNTTLGHYTLNATTTASGNVGVGSGVLQNTTTGSENTVVGAGSVFTAITPSNNTIIGAANLASGADAEGNVIVGYANLQKSLSTPTNCIVIGTGIKDGATDTMANSTLAIGHGDTPLVYGSLSSRSFDIKNGSLSVGSENDRHVLSISHGLSGVRDVTVVDLKDNVNAAAVSGVIALRFTDSDGDTRQLMEFDHASAAMTNSPSYVGPAAADPRPFVKLEGDMLLRGCVKFADGTYMDSANVQSNFAGTGLRLASVSYGKVMHIDYVNLKEAESLTPSVDTGSSYVAVSVASGTSDLVGKMSLQTLTSYMSAGTASIASNCNHLFSNSVIDTVRNSGTVMIGCNVAEAATGWKNAVMIGSEAGMNATTPNVGLATDTPAVFIGYRAGRDADNVSNSVFIGTNAGYLARNSDGSVFIGQSAGVDNSMDDSIGIGEHALRGTTNSSEGGKKNIEIVAGLLDNERLMYSRGHFDGRLNIQNSIAGSTDQRRISIGDAVLTPDAPLSARLDHAISGHSGIHNIQTWYCDDTKVAQVTCKGDFETLYSGIVLPQTIEGFAMSGMPCPESYSTPVSGLMKTKGYDFLDDIDVTIVNRDSTMTVHSGAYVVATRVNREYRPIWVNCSGV